MLQWCYIVQFFHYKQNICWHQWSICRMSASAPSGSGDSTPRDAQLCPADHGKWSRSQMINFQDRFYCTWSRHIHTRWKVELPKSWSFDMLCECGIEKGDIKSGRKTTHSCPLFARRGVRNQGRLQFRLQSHIGRAAEYTRRDYEVTNCQ
jgi:hypothetical protein